MVPMVLDGVKPFSNDEVRDFDSQPFRLGFDKVWVTVNIVVR